MFADELDSIDRAHAVDNKFAKELRRTKEEGKKLPGRSSSDFVIVDNAKERRIGDKGRFLKLTSEQMQERKRRKAESA